MLTFVSGILFFVGINDNKPGATIFSIILLAIISSGLLTLKNI